MDGLVNILIRTSKRPIFFKGCIDSIMSQNYRNTNIIVANDNNDTYCKSFKPIRVERSKMNNHRIGTARHFPYNLYLNNLMAEVKHGWVLMLDDDDCFTNPSSLYNISQHFNSTNNVIFWKVNIAGRIIPSNKNFKKHPVVKDISGIGFCFHSSLIPLIHATPYKQVDYRIAALLYDIAKPKWIDQILTSTQRILGDGGGKRDDKIL